MNDYSQMTQEEFDEALEQVIYEEFFKMRENGPGLLLGVPGIYEILSEHFNNEVLERYDEMKGRT